MSIAVILVVTLVIQVKMADDLKVYTPAEISDSPLPNEEGGEVPISSGGGGTANGNFNPNSIKPKKIPKKVFADETISQSLNTKSKKILAEFEFLQQGAIQIGEYVPGVSGDIKLSPNGIVARNSSGQTTLAIDGDTGNAVFQGEVRAADFIVSDENGLISLNNFNSDYVDNFNTQTVVPGGVPVEIDVSSGGGDPLVLEFDLVRDSNVLIFCGASGRNTTPGGFQLLAIYEDGGGAPFTQITGNLRISGAINDAAGGLGDTSASCTKILRMAAGHHRLALRHRAVGVQSVQIRDITLGFVVLGR